VLPRRVLLVGGAGFVGLALARRLAGLGCETHVLSRHAEPGRRDGIHFHRGSQADKALVTPLLAGCEAVVHLASTSTPGSTAHAPGLEVSDNLEPLAAFLETLVAAGPRRVIFLSSGGTIYGNPPALPATEDMPPQPLSWHAAGKLAAEELWKTCARRQPGTALAIVRPANVYGPGQPLRSGFGIVRTMLERALYSEPLEIWGDGSQVRDFLYIDDLIDACLRLLATPKAAGIFNAGAGKGTRLTELVRLAGEATGKPIPVVHRPERGIDVASIWLDCRRLRAATGWRAETALEDGLARTWAWMRTLPTH